MTRLVGCKLRRRRDLGTEDETQQHIKRLIGIALSLEKSACIYRSVGNSVSIFFVRHSTFMSHTDLYSVNQTPYRLVLARFWPSRPCTGQEVTDNGWILVAGLAKVINHLKEHVHVCACSSAFQLRVPLWHQ